MTEKEKIIWINNNMSLIPEDSFREHRPHLVIKVFETNYVTYIADEDGWISWGSIDLYASTVILTEGLDNIILAMKALEKQEEK